MNEVAASARAAETEPMGSRRDRFKTVLSKAESTYLEILRAVALLIATVLLVWIGWLIVSSAYNISRDAGAVVEEPVVITPQDVTSIAQPDENSSDGSGRLEGKSPAAIAFERFRNDYFQLYRTSFENFRQNDDTPLTRDQFAARYLTGFDQGTAARAELGADAFVMADDYPSILSTMRDAASLPITVERLEKYKSTPKVVVNDQVRRTRTESYCTYYSSYFDECFGYGTRTVPYNATVSRREPPAGVFSPQALFGAYQDNYLSKLNSRRDASYSKANRERAERLEANERGWLGMTRVVWFSAAFLGIMFFFLLIAIERHQRRMAAHME